MTNAQRFVLWDAINAVVAASGGNTGNTSVARQNAVVAVESAVASIETSLRDGSACKRLRGERDAYKEHAVRLRVCFINMQKRIADLEGELARRGEP